MFCPSYSRPVVTRGKTVVVTYDANTRRFPELYPPSVRHFYDRLYAWSARHATLVITTTEFARGDIARHYDVPIGKIRVVPMAADSTFVPMRDDPRVREIHRKYIASEEPFFRFVGKLSGRRNIPRLLRAFEELKRVRRVPHKLVVVGLDTRNIRVADLTRELGISEHVIHRDYVSDAELQLLYNAAEAFV